MIYNNLIEKKAKLAVIGLGYVGMPLAINFAKKINVIGFDTNSRKIKKYINGEDPTNEVGDDEIAQTSLIFTDDEKILKDAVFYIIAVPTPINEDKMPDLNAVINASQIVGRNMTKGSIVVYESTVYPGVTEDVCVRVLEETSNMKCGKDFSIGYSPERINPGDKLHRLTNIKKIVSGSDEETLEEIASIYELIIDAGVHRVSSIKVAEAAKVVENSQRDINVAFMNELAMVFDRMEIDTKEVIEAMDTKWNALNFKPGLVGGHCIGVDPYYFMYQAEKLGYHSQIISAGRKINDDMSKFVAEKTVKLMIQSGIKIKNAKVAVLGITFKENCVDIRNSRVANIIKELEEYGMQVMIADPYADANEVREMYGLELIKHEQIRDVKCIIVAVAHQKFMQITPYELEQLYGVEETEQKVLIDVKGIYDKQAFLELNYNYWRL